MAGGAQKTSQFNQATTVTQADQVPLLQGGELKRVTVGVLTGAPDFGWSATSESWTFSSYSSSTLIGVVTVPSDATTKYSVGMRVRFSQTTGGTKYGTIIAVTTTSLSIIFAGGATLANEAITTPVYSPLKAPFSGSVNLSDDGDSYSSSAYFATPMRWIDGKIIYKKTYVVTTTASGNTEQIFNIDLPAATTNVVKTEGGQVDSSTISFFYPQQYINPNAPSIQNSQGKLNIITGQWSLRVNTGGAGKYQMTVYFTL